MPTVPAVANPLTVVSAADDVPFDAIRAEHVEPAIHALLSEARASLLALEVDDRPRTYATTLGALETLAAPLGDAVAIVAHLESAATSPEWRAAYNAIQSPLSEFFTSLGLSEPVSRAVKDFAKTKEATELTGMKKRLLAKTLDDLRRSGAELGAEAKSRLSAIDVELTTATVRFAQNVLDATNAFELLVGDRAKLAGLPESAIEAARESAKERGLDGYRLTLQGPSYIPALTYLDDSSIRETLYRAYQTRATRGETDNRALLARILELRAAKATALGYASFADLVLEDRMAKSGAAALAFVEGLRERLEARLREENAELAAFARAEPAEIAPWDLLYWSEKQRRELYDFDEEALRPYFHADAVLRGVFEIAKRLYGATIEPWKDAPVWHPSVLPFRMRDAQGHEVASFYFDLFPRESKQEGAWMHGMISGAGTEASRHLAVVCASLSAPTADGGPALLRMREVETVFHEFGHLLHQCLSKVPIRSLAGTNVATDFVELPSKLMENWAWEKEALDLFARHHVTGARIPDELFAKLLRARKYRAANALTRQLGFAALDLALHTQYAKDRDGDVVAYARGILQRFSPVRLPDDAAMVASFAHLFASPIGYAAGYYSYPWADVLDADAFTRFKKEGLFNADVGKNFRESILASGNSGDPMDLYVSFMGREPKLDALLERTGLG